MTGSHGAAPTGLAMVYTLDNTHSRFAMLQLFTALHAAQARRIPPRTTGEQSMPDTARLALD